MDKYIKSCILLSRTHLKMRYIIFTFYQLFIFLEIQNVCVIGSLFLLHENLSIRQRFRVQYKRF